MVEIPNFTLRVIDVVAKCIVRAPHACRYTALSYVWGGAEQVILTSKNEKAISRPGGLPAGIPLTIQDAITSCRILGERYLLVDSLCIY
jgi:hypothetical protein